jgi:uncharacterized membrane protein (UPF0127 family)
MGMRAATRNAAGVFLRIARRAAPFLFTALAACAAGAAATELHFGRAEVTILTASGRYPFHVEVAKTPAQMERGLMFRRYLAPDAGMLFAYPAPTLARFWMHNTLIPLDMLFVDGKGRIVTIAARARPLSDRIITAAAPVRAVIELNGGTAARLGIKPGDRVLGAVFGGPH